MVWQLVLNKYLKKIQDIFPTLYRLRLISEPFLRSPFVYLFKKKDINEHLEDTTLLNIKRLNLIQAARLLIKKTKKETIDAMATYVFTNIKYDEKVLSMGWRERTAEDTLLRGYGVCSDRAILLTALLRIARIPSRLVEGRIKYDGKKNYGAHVWVEFYYWGDWRVVDPNNTAFFRTKNEEYIITDKDFFGEVGFRDVLYLNPKVFNVTYQKKWEGDIYARNSYPSTYNWDPFYLTNAELVYDAFRDLFTGDFD